MRASRASVAQGKLFGPAVLRGFCDAASLPVAHARTTFADEYRKLLLEAGVQFDERYML